MQASHGKVQPALIVGKLELKEEVMGTEVVEVQHLATKVAKLERENRGMRRLGALLAMIALSLALMGQKGLRAPVIEAEKFILRDSEGRARAALATLPDGSVSLVLSSSDKRYSVVVSVAQDKRPGVAIVDSRQGERAVLGLWDDRTPYLILRDTSLRERARFTLTSTGHPFIFMKDQSGKVIYTAP